MNQFQKKREEWTFQFKAKSDAELIKPYNSIVGLCTFGSYLSIYLSVLSKELLQRWDCSEIIYLDNVTNSEVFSFASLVVLQNRKLIK